ncbi:MAG: hypothetical protein WDW36_000031 [Sanguina aurantia]
MKSVSPHVRQQSTWTYNQDEDDFNARVGKILNRGLDMKGSMRASALQELKGQLSCEKEVAMGNTGLASNPAFLQQTVAQAPPVDTRGLVWKQLPQAGAARTAVTGGAPVTHNAVFKADVTGRGYAAMYEGLDAAQRSMHMWRRLNAGCVEATTKSPISTFQAHYQYTPERLEPTDFTRHLTKNDFTEYSEVKLKLMKHLGK